MSSLGPTQSPELVNKQAELAYLLSIRDAASQILTSFETLNQNMDSLILEAKGKLILILHEHYLFDINIFINMIRIPKSYSMLAHSFSY